MSRSPSAFVLIRGGNTYIKSSDGRISLVPKDYTPPPSKPKPKTVKPQICTQCGAALTSSVCEYCGTYYK